MSSVSDINDTNKEKKNKTPYLQAKEALRRSKLKGRVRLNDLTAEVEITETFDLQADVKHEFKEGLYNDYHDEAVLAYLHARHIIVDIGTVHRLVAQLAYSDPYNPLKDHVNSLPPWDGKKRLTTWLIDCVGAKDTEINRVISRKSLIQMIARALKPGCQAHTTVILEGAQGLGKTSLLRDLATPEFFLPHLPPIHKDHDIANAVSCHWVIELAELTSMSSARVDDFKSFLSRDEEKFTPKYRRYIEKRPRVATFWGTTNDSVYLKDMTGNRRFWPVLCKNVYLEKFNKMRSQLLAEAREAFLSGEIWHLTDEEEKLMDCERSERQTENVFLDTLREVLERDNERHFTSDQLWEELGVNSIEDRRKPALQRERLSAVEALGGERASPRGKTKFRPVKATWNV